MSITSGCDWYPSIGDLANALQSLPGVTIEARTADSLAAIGADGLAEDGARRCTERRNPAGSRCKDKAIAGSATPGRTALLRPQTHGRQRTPENQGFLRLPATIAAPRLLPEEGLGPSPGVILTGF